LVFTGPVLDQEKIWPVPPKYLLQAFLKAHSPIFTACLTVIVGFAPGFQVQARQMDFRRLPDAYQIGSFLLFKRLR